jgi:hypothetical protein
MNLLLMRRHYGYSMVEWKEEDELMSDNRYRIVDAKTGEILVTFMYSYLDDSCGIRYIHDWDFFIGNIPGNGTKFFKALTDHLDKWAQGECCKFMVGATHPDSKGDESYRNQRMLWDYLHSGKWMVGKIRKNPNSGNRMGMFEYDVSYRRNSNAAAA